MELTSPASTGVVARARDAEHLTLPDGTMTLLADSHATDGALSIHHTVLRDGANGASPHHHTAMAEVFYVLSGEVQVLVGEQVHLVGTGDLAVAPPGVAHAFAAAPGADAELLVFVTPGLQRFELFRHFARVASGTEAPGTLFEDQSQYDTFDSDSPAWREVRAQAG